jgi:2-deoxy-D-gluconate 3-dehydrogenase
MTSFDIAHRKAIITGGTSGIGLAIARGFLNAGARVVICGRNKQTGAQALATLASPQAHFLSCDVGEEDDCVALTDFASQQMGGIDTLVCAAGLNRRGRPETISLTDWDAVLNATLKGTFLAARACYTALKSSGDGRIVTIGSMMSVLANEATAPYAAAKGGVVQLTRSLAVSWATEGIRANCILPGWIDTAMTRKARHDILGLDARVRDRTPTGDWGHPDDIAGTAIFLATPASRFITGAAIPVDGGYLMRG